MRTCKAFEGFAHKYEPGDDYYVTAFAKDPECLVEDPYAHLGYPPCCVRSFNEWFPGRVDPMDLWSEGRPHLVYASPMANPLLRYLNVRFAPHIPCRFDCPRSVVLGWQFTRCMRNKDLIEARWELLTDRIEWDSYRGIAIVKTTPFRFVVRTDPLEERRVVRCGS
jgi:hypothetical protein